MTECWKEGCERPTKEGFRYCSLHAAVGECQSCGGRVERRKGMDTLPSLCPDCEAKERRIESMLRPCLVHGCLERAHRRSYCFDHHRRLLEGEDEASFRPIQKPSQYIYTNSTVMMADGRRRIADEIGFPRLRGKQGAFGLARIGGLSVRVEDVCLSGRVDPNQPYPFSIEFIET